MDKRGAGGSRLRMQSRSCVFLFLQVELKLLPFQDRLFLAVPRAKAMETSREAQRMVLGCRPHTNEPESSS